MPVTNASATDFDVASNSIRYPSPFFDLARNFIPRDIKTLFRYCRTFFYTNGFLRSVIDKLTEYPVTAILYDTDVDTKERDLYDKALHKQLKMKSFLIEIGMDFYTFGNAFVMAMLTHKRFLKCGSCEEEIPYENVNFEFKKFKFQGPCPACKAKLAFFTIRDEPIKSIKNFRLVRLAPDNIDVVYNSITGETAYFYDVPARVKNNIQKGNKFLLRTVPEIFLKAVKNKKKILLDNDNLFHFKAPSLAEDDMGFGKPIILPALKDIYYLQTLRRGNEAIAHEHIVPKKAVSPANTVGADPFSSMNLGKWRDEIQTTIKRWKRDSNYIAVFPIPIQYQELGGNARALLLTPEMKFVEESIMNSLGVPLEFIKGGVSWTGSSVSLRIVENHFLNYRELLLDFLNDFVIAKLVYFLNYPEVSVKFKKLKMSDDTQSKQQAIELNAAGKISDPELLDDFGYNYEEQVKGNKKSQDISGEMTIAAAKKEAEAQGEASVILAKYQAQAMWAREAEIFRIETSAFEDELSREHGGVPADPYEIIDQLTIRFLSQDPATQAAEMAKLKNTMPTTYMLVMRRMGQIIQSRLATLEAEIPSLAKAAPNQQEPGTRAKDKVKISDKEKTKGATRGNV